MTPLVTIVLILCLGMTRALDNDSSPMLPTSKGGKGTYQRRNETLKSNAARMTAVRIRRVVVLPMGTDGDNPVCCPSGRVTRVAENDYCTERPEGTKCGDSGFSIDDMCASGLCMDHYCKERANF